MNTIVLPASPLHLGKISVPVSRVPEALVSTTTAGVESYTNQSNAPEQVVLQTGWILAHIRNEVSSNLTSTAKVTTLLLSPGDKVEFQTSATVNAGFVIPLW